MVTKDTTTVITKTTKPKVIVQTKKLKTSEENTANTSSFCKPHKYQWIWKLVIILLLITNLIITFMSYLTNREMLRFSVMSNGGIENYQMIQSLYMTPAFQQASTLSIYQLSNRIEETLTSAQLQIEEQNNVLPY